MRFTCSLDKGAHRGFQICLGEEETLTYRACRGRR